MNKLKIRDILIFISLEILFLFLVIIVFSEKNVEDINSRYLGTVSLIWYIYSLTIVLIITKRRNVLSSWFKTENFLKDFLWSLKVFPILFISLLILGLLFPVNDSNYVGVNIKNLDNSQKILFVVVAIFLGPITEELIFRGMVYNFLKNFMRVEVSIIITSLIFALFHSLETFPVILMLSILMNYFYEIRSNLLVPITLHSLNNAIALLSLFTLGGV